MTIFFAGGSFSKLLPENSFGVKFLPLLVLLMVGCRHVGLGEMCRLSSKSLSLVACASGGSLFYIFLIIACISPSPGVFPFLPDGLVSERFGSKRRRFMPWLDINCPSNSHTAEVLDTALQLVQQRIKSAG